MKILSEELIRYESEKKALVDCEANLQRYQNIIKNAEFENARIDQELSGLDTDSDDGIAEKIAELEEKREELYAVMDKKNAHDAVLQEVSAKRDEFQKANATYETQLRLAESDLSTQKQQKAYMEDSGCADIENANCRFLKKAKEDASKNRKIQKKCISTIKGGNERGGKLLFQNLNRKSRRSCRTSDIQKKRRRPSENGLQNWKYIRQRNRGLKKAGSNVPAWRLKKSQTIKLSPHVLKTPLRSNYRLKR